MANWFKCLILFYLICVWNQKASPDTPSVSSPKYYRAECQILDTKFKIVRTLPGSGPCLFLADGTYIHTQGRTKLFKTNALGEVVWEIPGHQHHSLELDSEGNVMALASDFKNLIHKKVRADIVQKINPQGKVIAQFSFFNHAKELFKLQTDKPIVFYTWIITNKSRIFDLAQYEITHANSIYEVPIIARSHFLGAKYLVNEPVTGMCLGLNSELTRIVWHYNMKPGSITHDCQPLADGTFIYLENSGSLEIGKTKYSRIVRVKNGEEIFSFPKKGTLTNYFYADWNGGVELIPDGYLFSAIHNDTTLLWIVSHDGKWIRKEFLPYHIQDIKPLDAPSFLEKNVIR